MMKKKKLVRITAVVLTLILSVLAAGWVFFSNYKQRNSHEASKQIIIDEVFNQKNKEVEGYQKICENSNFELHADKTSGAFYIVQKLTGKMWYSSPADIDQDESSKKAEKNRMRSNLIIETVSLKDGKKSTYNCYSSSVRKDSALYEEVESGYRMVYNLIDEKISIPVNFKLEPKGLRVSVDVKGIKEQGNERIFKLNLLPYFLSAGRQAQGYMIVPDGSGSIIHLNSEKFGANPYQQKLFERNEALLQYIKSSNFSKGQMPIYAIKADDQAILAVITKGEADAGIKADISGRTNGYNSVSSTFDVRYIDVYAKVSERQVDIDVYQNGESGLDACEVLYLPETKEGITYSDIAGMYADYLKNTYKLQQKTDHSDFYLTVYGGVVKKKALLGIPVDRLEKLSTFKQTEQLLHEMKNLGITNAKIRMNNWSTDGIWGRLLKDVDAEKELGGQKGLKSLLTAAADINFDIFTGLNPVEIKRGGLFSNIYDTAKTMQGMPIKLFSFKPNTYLRDDKRLATRLIRMGKIEQIAEGCVDSLSENGIRNVALNGLFDILYQDYGSDNPSMTTTHNKLLNALSYFSDHSDDLISDSFTEKALPYTSCFLGLSYSGSGYDLTDQEIPFLQIALSGLVDFTYTAVNLDSDPREVFLKSVETGGNLHFEWIASEATQIEGTELDWLHGAYYKPWVEQAAEYFSELNHLKSLTQDSAIDRHEQVLSNVYKTVYKNGTTVYVNYNDTELTADGTVVPAKGYRIEERRD